MCGNYYEETPQIPVQDSNNRINKCLFLQCSSTANANDADQFLLLNPNPGNWERSAKMFIVLQCDNSKKG